MFNLKASARATRTCYRTLWCIPVLVVLAVSAVNGQSLGAGAIEGTIVDDSGAALPGVTVTADGPALQVPQVLVVSGLSGSYRFPTLPAGVYLLRYSLRGFQTVVRQDLRLTGGFVATINIEMKIGTIEEALTVVGQSPVVDVRTTSGQTNLTQEMLDTAPVTRTMWNVLAMAPGMRVAQDVGGSTTGVQQAYSNYGVSGQTTPMLEGINTREGANSAGFFYDYGSMAEVQIKSLGSGAEVATPGTNWLGIVKSGGNEFHGRYVAAGQTDKLQSNNLDDDLRARGVTEGDKQLHYYDLSADIGGRIIRDKLWFYGSLLRQANMKTRLGYSKAPGPDNRFGTPDDEQGFNPMLITNESLKMSYQPTPKNRLIGFIAHNVKYESESEGSRFRPFPSTQDYDFNPTAWKGELQSTPTKNLLINVLGGYVWYGANRRGQPKFNIDVPGNPSRRDIATGMFDGPHEAIWNRWRKHWTSTGSATLFSGGMLGDSHSLKVGYSVDLEHLGIDRQNKPSGNYQLTFDNGAPLQITTYNLPVNGSGTRMDNYGVYVQDTWTIGSRLTLNLGLRAERYHNFVDSVTKPQGTFGTSGTFPYINVVTWDHVVPRVGAAFDVTGDAKTVLKGTYGLYTFNPSVDFADPYNQNSLESTVYRWRDLNGNRDYDTGEVNLSTSGPDFVSRTGASNVRLSPDLQQPVTKEISAQLEREVLPNVSLKAVYVHKTIKNLYATVNTLRPYEAYDVALNRQDPGPDGVIGTADDGGFLTLFDYNPVYRGAAFVGNAPANRSIDPDRYQTMEVTANVRRTRNLDLLASIATTKNRRSLITVPQSPNDEIFPLDETWTWTAKMTASYSAPHAIQLSAYYTGLSGAPRQRTYVFRNMPQSSTVTIRVAPYGESSLPSQHIVNFRVGRRFTIKNFRLDANAELFNALNVNTIVGMNDASGPSYDAVTGIIPPRIVRLGATLSF